MRAARMGNMNASVIAYLVVKAHPVLEMKLLLFLTSALDGGKWSTSRSDRLTPGIYWVSRRIALGTEV
jgi:hypothetical protein